MSAIASPSDAVGKIGDVLGTSEWLTITQDMIASFGKVTGDEQWIHVDPVRAQAGPFGACIAHGQLTFALAKGRFFHEIVRTAAEVGVNYGCDRLRYPAPVHVGKRVRGRAELMAAQVLDANNVQLTVRITVEIEGE